MLDSNEMMFLNQFLSSNTTNKLNETRSNNIYQMAQKSKIFYLILVNSGNKRRLQILNGTTYEIIDINPFNGTQVRIFIPTLYLTQNYNKSIDNFAISSYKNYPLINSNFENNFSDVMMSLKMFTENMEKINVKNLTYPIGFLFTKSTPNLGSCIFLDEVNQ